MTETMEKTDTPNTSKEEVDHLRQQIKNLKKTEASILKSFRTLFYSMRDKKDEDYVLRMSAIINKYSQHKVYPKRNHKKQPYAAQRSVRVGYGCAAYGACGCHAYGAPHAAAQPPPPSLYVAPPPAPAYYIKAWP